MSKLIKDMLDRKISEFETLGPDKTFRQWIYECEDLYGLEHTDLNSLTDNQLDNYDTWLCELSDK